MTDTRKTNHVLPPSVAKTFEKLNATDNIEDRNAYIAVLRRKGWTLQSLAGATGITRERVRQIATSAPEDVTTHFDVPDLPVKASRATTPRVKHDPHPDTLARLLDLKEPASKVRSSSPKFRAEAEEYGRLLWQAHRPVTQKDKAGVPGEGVSVYRLAQLLGVTHAALRFRLSRYGYIKPKTGKSRVYQAIDEKNRVR